MTFDKDFPNVNWKWEFIGNERKSMVTTKELKRSCLDKERVTKSIERGKVSNPFVACPDNPMKGFLEWLNDFEKEFDL